MSDAETAGATVAPGIPHGRIGPNSVIQLGHALTALRGRETARAVFDHAGYPGFLDAPPDDMIDEAVPVALFAALWRLLPDEAAAAVARDAGRRTAAYILDNRIPRPVKRLLRLLPPRLAAARLLAAIEKNAWTFVGSGACRTQARPACAIEIENNPLKMPDCQWHQGVFERLFQELVAPRAEVRHRHGGASRTQACRFEVRIAA